MSEVSMLVVASSRVLWKDILENNANNNAWRVWLWSIATPVAGMVFTATLTANPIILGAVAVAGLLAGYRYGVTGIPLDQAVIEECRRQLKDDQQRALQEAAQQALLTDGGTIEAKTKQALEGGISKAFAERFYLNILISMFKSLQPKSLDDQDSALLHICATLSLFAYQPSQPLPIKLPQKLEELQLGKFPQGQDLFVRAFVNTKTQTLFITFRGSHTFSDWLSNLNVNVEHMDETGLHVHQGVLDTVNKLWPALLKLFKTARQAHGVRAVVVTGHSRGGACASITLARLINLQQKRDADFTGLQLQCCTFGAPHWLHHADPEASELVQKIGSLSRLIINQFDPVPRLLGNVGTMMEYCNQVGKLFGIQLPVPNVVVENGNFAHENPLTLILLSIPHNGKRSHFRDASSHLRPLAMSVLTALVGIIAIHEHSMLQYALNIQDAFGFESVV